MRLVCENIPFENPKTRACGDNLFDADSRLSEFADILSQADLRCFEELRGARFAKSVSLDGQIAVSDQKHIRRIANTRISRYNLTQTAHLLKVHRQTIYY